MVSFTMPGNFPANVQTVHSIPPSRTKRLVYGALGWLFVGIAIAGAFLPLIPVTINVILAGFFFARSSERFDTWLVQHRVFGPIITDYRSGVGFTARAKTVAVVAMSASILGSTWWALSKGAPGFVGVGMALVWAWAAWFILKQPTKPAVS